MTEQVEVKGKSRRLYGVLPVTARMLRQFGALTRLGSGEGVSDETKQILEKHPGVARHFDEGVFAAEIAINREVLDNNSPESSS